jgi:protein-tyrosine-phosphatase
MRLLADPVRWRLARELAAGDRRVRELVAAIGQPQSLVSYHLRQLRSGGLVSALAGAAAVLHHGLAGLVSEAGAPGRAGGAPARRRVLFVCTGNSSRSPMAEGLLRHRAGTRVAAASAGIRPKPVHPHAVAVMRDRFGLDIAGHRPAQVETAARERFDYVISLCDKAREACPEFTGNPGLIHWSLPDPAAGEGGLAGYPAFERTAAELDARIGYLLPALDQAAPARG